jgi:hypothetical protein
MAAFLSRVRERGPQLWGVRLLLGVSLLGLLLAGVWQGEIHSHDNASAAHSHGHDHDTTETDPPSGGSAAEPLHIHDAAVTVVMAGPPAVSAGLPPASATWMPDDPPVHAPPTSFNTPHRPPIV